jgi:ABC-2 type transport system permease protein
MRDMRHRLTQITRLVAKEWRLLLRNPHGLAVLFFMPAIFVLVMSFTLRNTLVMRVELPVDGWVLEDTGPAATRWAAEWQQRHGSLRFPSRQAMQAALKKGQISAGVIVHAPWLSSEGKPRAEQLELWFANQVQPAAAARLRAELAFSMLQVQLKMAAAEGGPFASVLLDDTANADLFSAAPVVRYLYEVESGRAMTAVQQSVPGWLIFGMFFVVIPIASVLIQERNDGTLARLAGFGVSPTTLLHGKLAAFMLLNWVQLVFMLLVGRFLVPLLGGDTLHLDVSLGWFLVMVACTSAAAVGLALLIAAYCQSFDHAAALGGGVNVVLAAIAGIMVPRALMPPGLQLVSAWSPMGWALDGMQSVFLGAPDSGTILPRAGALLGLAAVCIWASGRRLRRQQRTGA